MFNLLSRDSLSEMDLEAGGAAVQMAEAAAAGKGMAPFFEETNAIKAGLEELAALLVEVGEAHHESKSLHKAADIRSLKNRMAEQVKQILALARSTKLRLERLEADNVASRKIEGCEVGSLMDRTRVLMTLALREKLKKVMDDFGRLRDRMSQEHKSTLQRRYFTITGEEANEETIDHIIETGQSEEIITRAVQQQGIHSGRAQIVDTIQEIQARHDAVQQMEKSLLELQQIFMDMAVLVEHQGEQLNSIQHHVERAESYVEKGRGQLERAKKSQRSSRKWTCIAIIILLVLLIVIVVPIVNRK